MITIVSKGDFKKTRKTLEKAKRMNIRAILDKYGKEGVAVLADATPKDSGETANSWSYEVKMDHHGASIFWSNSNINDGVNIAVILNYGHGTGTGGFVKGSGFISPAIRPIFDDISQKAWEEVTK